MTIKNFGLMWDRDGVVWHGVKNNAGRLLGMGPIGVAQKDQKEADFREQIGVYILYEGRRVVYVGQASSGNAGLFKRLKDHTRDHLADRWDKFSWFGIRNVNKGGRLSKQQGELKRILNASEVLDLIEGLLINSLEPPLNKQGAQWRDISQYYQVFEGWSAWSDREILTAIAEKQGIEPDS